MELNDLYQEIIIDHNREPRNHHVMQDATCECKAYNPLCGDQMTIYLKMANDCVEDVSFVGEGCAISMASASLLTEQVKGKTAEEAKAIFTQVHQLLTGSEDINEQVLGKLLVLSGVCAFPSRVKCASLAWHALSDALTTQSGEVSTE